MKYLLKSKIIALCLALTFTFTACSDNKEIDSLESSNPPITQTESTEVPSEQIKNNEILESTSAPNPNQNTVEPTEPVKVEEVQQTIDLKNIPPYSGSYYIAINDNIPFFNDDEMTDISFESYSNLDNLGRCGIATASVGLDIMPTEDRGSISSVTPTGWEQEQYTNVDGGWLYNRCHILGFQLTGENANEKNLMTGTRQMNVDAMLPFENMVADYVQETGNHVYMRVTPIFEGNNLLATGVLMEAKSVEDDGEGVLYNVFCYNAQDGINLDYATGDNSSPYVKQDEVEPTSPPVTESQTGGSNEGNISDVDTNGNGTVGE